MQITASAFTQARSKLSYRFFEDANAQYVSDIYQDSKLKTFKGFRVLAIDGSDIRLPDSAEVYNEFGTVVIKNSYNLDRYTASKCTVLYDVINEIVLAGTLGESRGDERLQAMDHIKDHCQSGDLLVLDRAFPSYRLLSVLEVQKSDYVIRCPSGGFKKIVSFTNDSTKVDEVIELKADRHQRELIGDIFKVRLIKIKLDSGERVSFDFFAK